MAEAPKDETQGGDPGPQVGSDFKFWDALLRNLAKSPGSYAMGAIGFLLMIIILGVIAYELGRSGTLLRDLSDPAHARGIITFIISFAAIGVALLMIVQSLFGTTKSDQYRQAREIYTGLMGILGTIVGFYFGSSDKAVPPLTLTEPRFLGREIVTTASGGVGPYRYHVTPDSLSDSTAMGERVSLDGWIQHKLKSDRPADLKITVWDSKNNQVAKELQADKAPKAAGKPRDTAAAAPGDTSRGGSGSGAAGSHFPKGR